MGGIRSSQVSASPEIEKPPVLPEVKMPRVAMETESASGGEVWTSRNWIALAYTGQVRLWKVFWFGYVVPLVPLTIARGIYKEVARDLPSWVGFVCVALVCLYQAWLVIALWRCAPNVKRPQIRRLARGFAVFLGFMTLASLNYFLSGA